VRALFLISSLALSALCSRTSPGIRVLWSSNGDENPRELDYNLADTLGMVGLEGLAHFLDLQSVMVIINLLESD